MSDNSQIQARKKKTDVELCLFFIFLFILLVTVDQFLKKLIDTEMDYYGQKVIIPDFFSLYYVRNTGSAFSLFADKPWGIYFLSGVSILLGVVIFVFMIKSSVRGFKLISLAFCLLTSGAVGNRSSTLRISARYWERYF